MGPNLYTAYGKTLTAREWFEQPECQSTDKFETFRQRLKTRPIKVALAPEPRRGRKITIDGETKALIEWSEDERCPVKFSTICGRLDKGWSERDAIFLPNQLITGEYIEAWGEQKTFSQWLRDDRCNISTKKIYYERIEAGMSSESALEAPVRRADEFDGWGQRKTLKQWAEDPRAAVDAKTMYDRIRVYGWSVEDAVSTPIPPAPKYAAFGKELTISEWIREPECKVKREILRRRLHDGWEPEKAISEPMFKDREYEAFGESKTLMEWSEDPRFNYDYLMLLGRINKGMSLEDAVIRLKKEDEQYFAFGESKTLIEWSNDDRCNCEYIVLRDRLSRGFDLEDAITRPTKEPVLYTAFGETKTASEWLLDDRCVLKNNGTFNSRIKIGMSIEDALTEPIMLHDSKGERNLVEFIDSLDLECTRNDRTIIPPQELDVYIPEKKIAIEFNGLYWHSEKYKDKNYHYNKWKSCKEKGIQLLQIWEDDWIDRREIVESMLTYKLGLNSERIYARDTIIDLDVPWNQAKQFLDSNHIQGSVKATHYVGLRCNGVLVALCCFTKSQQIADWDLTRFATSCSVVGGFSKILKNFRREHAGSIKSFADLMISDGGLYEKNGFTMDKILKPDYSYFVNNNPRIHKFLYRKKRFRDDKDLKYDPDMTEFELAELNGLLKIYDAGKARYILK